MQVGALFPRSPLFIAAFLLFFVKSASASDFADWPNRISAIMQQRAAEADSSYRASRFSILSSDYLARLARDPAAPPRRAEEIVFNRACVALRLESRSAVARTMAAVLVRFLRNGMRVPTVMDTACDGLEGGVYAIELTDQYNLPDAAGTSFMIEVSPQRTIVAAPNSEALRDGIVRFVNDIGLRGAPILQLSRQVYTPHLSFRLGVVPWLGSMRDVALMGYNAVLLKPYADLHEISRSRVIPDDLPRFFGPRLA